MKNTKNLIICLLTLISVSLRLDLFAQNIENLEESLRSMRGSSESRISSEAEKLYGLVHNNSSTIYLQNGRLIQQGQGNPNRIISDVTSLALLGEDNPLFAHVEMICIRLESESDLKLIFNTPSASVFKTLKYIYFLCTFEACPSDPSGSCLAEKLLKNYLPSENLNLKVYYKYSISQ